MKVLSYRCGRRILHELVIHGLHLRESDASSTHLAEARTRIHEPKSSVQRLRPTRNCETVCALAQLKLSGQDVSAELGSISRVVIEVSIDISTHLHAVQRTKARRLCLSCCQNFANPWKPFERGLAPEAAGRSSDASGSSP